MKQYSYCSHDEGIVFRCIACGIVDGTDTTITQTIRAGCEDEAASQLNEFLETHFTEVRKPWNVQIEEK